MESIACARNRDPTDFSRLMAKTFPLRKARQLSKRLQQLASISLIYATIRTTNLMAAASFVPYKSMAETAPPVLFRQWKGRTLQMQAKS